MKIMAFIRPLFYDVFSSSQYIASDNNINCQWRATKRSCPTSTCYSGIRLEAIYVKAQQWQPVSQASFQPRTSDTQLRGAKPSAI